MNTSETNANLLSVKQVSAYLSINERTVQRLSTQGEIKAVKIGGQWKFNKEDIERYLNYGTIFSNEPVRKPNDFTKKRAYSRINSNFKCRYAINLPPFKEINNEGIIKNLSAGGAFLTSQNNVINGVEISDPIDMNFNLISNNKTILIKIEGRIIRKNNTGVGIKFRNMNEETKNRIIQYIG